MIPISHAAQASDVNAALFCDFDNTAFIETALSPFLERPGCFVVTDSPSLLPKVPANRRLAVQLIALDTDTLDSEAVLAHLKAQLARSEGLTSLLVDMTWVNSSLHGARSIETWGASVEKIAHDFGVAVISLYNQEVMVEDLLQAAFRVHRLFSAPTGLYENPYWLPPTVLEGGTVEEQLAYMLTRVVPDYEGQVFVKSALPQAARGTTPGWLSSARHSVVQQPAQNRWHIHCLGQLRVYIGNNQRVDWKIKGGAPKKAKVLFAYLLNCGEKGAPAEQLSELLWPDGDSEDIKRSRLHHTVAMLRKALGDQSAVLRAGDYYRLNAPQGSWIDIHSFEQHCRRGLALFRNGQLDAALRIYKAAETLYAGDLFEDLPQEYVQTETEDWCMARRTWLREMCIRLQYDTGRLLRLQNRLREALDHCQKALHLDPTNEHANAEAMRIYMAQGRREAIDRQYRQYCAAIDAIGAGEIGETITDLYQELYLNT